MPRPRFVLAALVIALVALLALPAGPARPAAISAATAAPIADTAPQPPPPPPPPSHCDDYQAMEAGLGHPENQRWFNGLAARHGDKGYARLHIACVYGWGGDQWAALDELWQLEADGGDDRNGHDWHHANVPQAKPFRKMGCATWDHRCQDRWGARYIAERYGSPVAALQAWLARRPHWY